MCLLEIYRSFFKKRGALAQHAHIYTYSSKISASKRRKPSRSKYIYTRHSLCPQPDVAIYSGSNGKITCFNLCSKRNPKPAEGHLDVHIINIEIILPEL